MQNAKHGFEPGEIADCYLSVDVTAARSEALTQMGSRHTFTPGHHVLYQKNNEDQSLHDYDIVAK